MTAPRQLAPRALVGLLLGAWLVAHACFGLLPGAFGPWNMQTTDLLFRARQATGWGAPEVDPRFVCVDVTDETTKELGVADVDAAMFTRASRALAEMGVALQVHDALYLHASVEPAPGTVVGLVARLDRPGRGAAEPGWSIRVEGDAGALPRAIAPVAGAVAAPAGFLDVTPDRDGVHRRLPLLARGDDGYVPSLALAAAVVYLDVDPAAIVLRPGRSLTLPGRDRTVVVPIDRRGRLRVNVVPWDAWRHKSFVDVLDAGRDASRRALHRPDFDGAIALVSDTSTAGGDIAPTPFHPYDPKPGLHLSALHDIVTGRFLVEWGWREMLGIEIALLLALYFLAWRGRTRAFLAGAAGLLVLFAAAALLLFCFAGVVVHVARPLVAVALGTGALTAYRYLAEERLRARVQGSFEAFFPPKVVRRLIADPERIRVGGERKTLTMLFSDIKGFTARTADMDPDDVQQMLNVYFAEMVDVVFAHGGTLDKFIGDGLMVFFGDPEDQPDHAARAVRCGVAMQRRLRELAGAGATPIEIRVGIHSGPVVVGNMGSPKRLSYTVLGSAVNLAARLEPKAPVGGVLISEATRAALPQGEFDTREVDRIEAKGFSDPVRAFAVEIG